MHGTRPAFALDPKRFGRRFVLRDARAVSTAPATDDVRLFAATFAAGFLFVSVFFA